MPYPSIITSSIGKEAVLSQSGLLAKGLWESPLTILPTAAVVYYIFSIRILGSAKCISYIGLYYRGDNTYRVLLRRRQLGFDEIINMFRIKPFRYI